MSLLENTISITDKTFSIKQKTIFPAKIVFLSNKKTILLKEKGPLLSNKCPSKLKFRTNCPLEIQKQDGQPSFPLTNFSGRHTCSDQ